MFDYLFGRYGLFGTTKKKNKQPPAPTYYPTDNMSRASMYPLYSCTYPTQGPHSQADRDQPQPLYSIPRTESMYHGMRRQSVYNGPPLMPCQTNVPTRFNNMSTREPRVDRAISPPTAQRFRRLSDLELEERHQQQRLMHMIPTSYADEQTQRRSRATLLRRSSEPTQMTQASVSEVWRAPPVRRMSLDTACRNPNVQRRTY